MRADILCIIAFCLYGCTSASEIADRPGSADDTVAIIRPYEEVYRSVRDYTKKCFESGVIPGLRPDVRVESELYPDAKRAEVQVVLTSLSHPQTRIEIDATTPTITKVTIKYASGMAVARDQNTLIFAAARGSSASCP
jgi:hypothetical protein